MYVITTFCSVISFAQSSGDVLFIGFNADGDKDFSIITMVDISPNTTIYFTDNGPNLVGDGNMGSEGVLQWNTGGVLIPVGTVVVFTDVDSSSNIGFGCSVGELIVVDAGFNISSSGDVIYATYGNPVEAKVTKWISGIQNSNTGLESNFESTGLSVSSNYIVIDDTGSKDGGEYVGEKVDKTKEEFMSLIVDEANWTTSTTDGESMIPFNQTGFIFQSLSTKRNFKDIIQLKFEQNKFIVNKGNIIDVVDCFGRKIGNNNLPLGIYFIQVQYNNRLELFKILAK